MEEPSGRMSKKPLVLGRMLFVLVFSAAHFLIVSSKALQCVRDMEHK